MMSKFLRELRRLKWLLGVALLSMFLLDVYAINGQNRWALLAHKFSVVTMAAILAHIVRSELWPYIDLKEIFSREDDYGAKIGASLLIGLFMAALILGVTLGL